MAAEPIEDIAVVGAGRMGHGIALSYALAGHAVNLTDADETVLEASSDRIESALGTLADAGRVSETGRTATLARVTPVETFEAAVSDVDFVTEAVSEDLSIKQSVFGELDRLTRPDTLLATNTSGLSIDAIGEPVEDQTRVLGTHWFNPPHLVPLVEIVAGSETDESAIGRTRSLLESAGKTPVVVRKDIPGFIGNRIQAAMSYEAFSLLERGVATPQDIDRAVKAGFGFRLPIMGIFEKMDQSGLDIHYEVEKSLMGDLDRGTAPGGVLDELLASGDLGTETGKGIYDWEDVDLDETYHARDRALLAMLDLYESIDRDSPPANYDRT